MYHDRERPDAAAYLVGGKDAPELTGTVRFYQEAGRVLVVADVEGLPQNSESGFFAFHIHEGSFCLGTGFPETGGHYNPEKEDHPHHAGDLPPLLAYRGCAFLVVRTDRFRVRDIIGRTVVIHGDADDFHTQPSGNAGMKIAYGVIRKR